ncbi:hypothetical protein Hanom_Chr02g00114581 [Helianthus anomalus]
MKVQKIVLGLYLNGVFTLVNCDDVIRLDAPIGGPSVGDWGTELLRYASPYDPVRPLCGKVRPGICIFNTKTL